MHPPPVLVITAEYSAARKGRVLRWELKDGALRTKRVPVYLELSAVPPVEDGMKLL